MTAMAENTLDAVRKSVTVNATPKEAFQVFTEDFDSWWPRSHHIGKSPMKKAIIPSLSFTRLQRPSTSCLISGWTQNRQACPRPSGDEPAARADRGVLRSLFSPGGALVRRRGVGLHGSALP